MIDLKILKLNLFQETACYKKPFAYKVAETYPLPPYSTVIGMLHKILQAKPGEYFPMNISIQGEFESIFSNYQNLRMFKVKDVVTAMPRNVHQLLNIKLVIHIGAEDDVIDKIYNNILIGKETFTLGRNEDLVRIDGIKILKDVKPVIESYLGDYNAYVPKAKTNNGINYRLNTVYKIDEKNLRRWAKTDVKYIEKDSNETVQDVLEDEDGDLIIFYK